MEKLGLLLSFLLTGIVANYQTIVRQTRIRDYRIKKVFVIVICVISLCSCKRKEEKVENVVSEFLSEINDKTKTLNHELMTENFATFFEGKSYYTSQDWALTVKPQNDSMIIVEAKGKSHNNLGQPIEILQGFALTNIYGKWQIGSSYNLVADNIDIQIGGDTQWGFYWDRDKDYILNELREKLELQVLIPAYNNSFWGNRGGKLRIDNNSDFDIRVVTVLIEHFDNQGKSVKIDHEYVRDIRKNGYREFEWATYNCEKCEREEIKIMFTKENL